MFSLVSDWVSSAAAVVNDISGECIHAVHQTGILDVLDSVSDNPNASAAAATSSGTTVGLIDIMAPPPVWAGSEEEWIWCVKAALCDPNTCAITPTTLRSDASLWEEIKTMVAQLSAIPPQPEKGESLAPVPTDVGPEASASAASEVLENFSGTLTPTTDLVKYIQENYNVYKVRSDVVPRFTSDENYWLNIKWRADLYRQCTDPLQLLTLMRLLSRLPQQLRDRAEAAIAKQTSAVESYQSGNERHQVGNDDDDGENGDIQKAIVLSDNTEYWRDIQEEYESIHKKFVWVQEMEERVKKEIQLASSNVKLLASLLQRREASTSLGASVFDSCQYHKVRLSRLIADICAAPIEHSEGSVLDLKTGTLFQALAKCNDDVKAVLETYVGHPSGDTEDTKSLVASPSLQKPSEERRGLPAPEEEADTEMGAGGATTSGTPKAEYDPEPCPVEVSASVSHGPLHPDSSADENDDDLFEAKLPWFTGNSES